MGRKNDRCDPEQYFEHPPGSVLIRIDLLDRDHLPAPEKIQKATELLNMARHGKHPKREPITIRSKEDGRYLVLDGNTTTTVLKSWGCEWIVARDVDSAISGT
jgi:hypothetical protein